MDTLSSTLDVAGDHSLYKLLKSTVTVKLLGFVTQQHRMHTLTSSASMLPVILACTLQGSGFPFRRRVLTVLLITIFPFYIQKLVSWFRFFRDLQLQIVEIIVADISTFEKDASYDRIHCIGMFEVGEFHATLGM